MKEKIIEPELEKRLKTLGINVDALLRCFKAYCKTKRGSGLIVREPGFPFKMAKDSRPADLSATDLAVLAQIDDLKGIVTRFAMGREMVEPGFVATRTEEKEVTHKSLADERIMPIPDKGFYTKPIANKNNKVSDQNKTKKRP